MSRRRVLGVCAALPACIVAAVGLWSFLTNNRGGWVWPPDAVTMSEAVVTGDYAEVVRQLERGVDPNPPEDVRARLLADTNLRVTPLQAAVRARNPLMVKMLLDRAVVTATGLAVLKCMNDENGNQEVRALLDALPAEATAPSCDQLSLP